VARIRSGDGTDDQTFKSSVAVELAETATPVLQSDHASTEWPSAETPSAGDHDRLMPTRCPSRPSETQLNKVRDSLVTVPGPTASTGMVTSFVFDHNDLDQVERRHTQFDTDLAITDGSKWACSAITP
jgi:hypothetical protein